jgi:site-specific recombinase XerD
VAGRGHLERRGPEQWRLVVYRGRDRATGRRRYERRLFHGSEEEAQVALARFVVELADANFELDPRRLTVGEVLDLWYSHVLPDLEATTAQTYRHELNYVPESLRALPLRRLTTEQLEELYRQLRASGRRRDNEGLSQKFVRSIHQRIDAALRFAKRRRWITVNPAADVEFANSRKSDRRRPTPAPLADVQAVLRRAQDVHGLAFAVYLRVSAVAGGRRGEVHGLRWMGVDWQRGRVRLADNIVRAGPTGWIVKRSPKDDEPRLVALGPATMSMLRRLRTQAETGAETSRTTLVPDAFVFSDAPDGSQPWVPTTTWLRYKRLSEECGIRATRLHDLRAMMSTELVERGVPIPVVSARLGHAQNSTTAITLDVYTGRNPALDRQAGELMDLLLDTDL